MARIQSFLFGMIVGAAALYGAMTFHVVRAEDGLHVVPKISSGISDAYVDIRDFDAAEWSEHKHVAVALIHADKEELLQESMVANLRNAARGALESLGLR